MRWGNQGPELRPDRDDDSNRHDRRPDVVGPAVPDDDEGGDQEDADEDVDEEDLALRKRTEASSIMGMGS